MNNTIIYKTELCLLYILVIGMLVFPTAFMSIKLIIILFLIINNFLLGRYKIKYEKISYYLLGIIIVRGVWVVGNGIIKETLTDSQLYSISPYFLLYPFLFFLLFPNLRGENSKQNFSQMIITAHTLIIATIIYNLLANIYGLPIINIAENLDKIYYDNNYLEFGLNNLHQLIFTTPFVISLGLGGKIKPLYFIPLFIVSITILILSSRAALIIVLIVSLLIFFIPAFNPLFIKKNKKIRLVIGIILTFSFIYFSNNTFVNSSIENFKSHFNKDTDIRFNQREVLYDEWMKMPLTGHGEGKKFNIYERGYVSEFESTYHSDLAHNGIIGFALFCLYIGITIISLFNRVINEQDTFYFGCLLGLICCLICASTNPILGSFDRLFSVFICIACLSLPSRNNARK